MRHRGQEVVFHPIYRAQPLVGSREFFSRAFQLLGFFLQLVAVRDHKFPAHEFNSLDEVVKAFQAQGKDEPEIAAACFGCPRTCCSRSAAPI